MNYLQSAKPGNVKVIASAKTWIESDAIKQLETTAKLEGMIMAVGLPDLHPGKTYPIGAAFICKEWIYPTLVGNDIGCGMGFWKTDLKTNKMKPEKWVDKLYNLDSPWEGDSAAFLHDRQVETTVYDGVLGTIGGGNHFAELQKIESIQDAETFNSLGMEQQNLYLLVHSGSRGLGESILRSHIDAHGHQGLLENTAEAHQYLKKHDHAVNWAEANRSLIAYRFLSCLRADGEFILDINHNTVIKQEIDGHLYWLHRKGATPATQGCVVIPGSRGSFSYLVQPVGEQINNAYSLAHGAGRKWKRTDAKGRLSNYRIDDLTKTSLGGHVICEDKSLLFEEAPQAYKNIETVVQDFVDMGLIQVIAILRPVVTYKTRRRL
jgi:release factor H-coupled RctB family protein